MALKQFKDLYPEWNDYNLVQDENEIIIYKDDSLLENPLIEKEVINDLIPVLKMNGLFINTEEPSDNLLIEEGLDVLISEDELSELAYSIEETFRNDIYNLKLIKEDNDIKITYEYAGNKTIGEKEKIKKEINDMRTKHKAKDSSFVEREDVLSAIKRKGLVLTKEAEADLDWNIVDYINEREITAEQWLKEVIAREGENSEDYLFVKNEVFDKYFNHKTEDSKPFMKNDLKKGMTFRILIDEPTQEVAIIKVIDVNDDKIKFTYEGEVNEMNIDEFLIDLNDDIELNNVHIDDKLEDAKLEGSVDTNSVNDIITKMLALQELIKNNHLDLEYREFKALVDAIEEVEYAIESDEGFTEISE